ncbi:hypothetical protein [Bosea minatitlanensis]|uniref:EamA domain-containing protein n=1 Tax=Bosea minatitlanensis TaxID=128782 RepID=A0ABW0F5D5_9HYPH
MLLLALMWGVSIPITKLGLLSLPPLTLTALRFAIAVPLMFGDALGLLFVLGVVLVLGGLALTVTTSRGREAAAAP